MMSLSATHHMQGRETLHARLKGATAALHRQAEAALLLDEKLRDVTGYIAFLQILYRLHAAYEVAFEQFDFAVIGIENPRRCKSAWLTQDLECFGLLPDFSTVQTIEMKTFSEGLGSLYVVEGSMLGNQLIARMVHERLGFSTSLGSRFFLGYGSNTLSKWRRLLDALDAAPAETSQTIIAAAAKTFEMFISISQTGPKQRFAGQLSSIADPAH